MSFLSILMWVVCLFHFIEPNWQKFHHVKIYLHKIWYLLRSCLWLFICSSDWNHLVKFPSNLWFGQDLQAGGVLFGVEMKWIILNHRSLWGEVGWKVTWCWAWDSALGLGKKTFGEMERDVHQNRWEMYHMQPSFSKCWLNWSQWLWRREETLLFLFLFLILSSALCLTCSPKIPHLCYNSTLLWVKEASGVHEGTQTPSIFLFLKKNVFWVLHQGIKREFRKWPLSKLGDCFIFKQIVHRKAKESHINLSVTGFLFVFELGWVCGLCNLCIPWSKRKIYFQVLCVLSSPTDMQPLV